MWVRVQLLCVADRSGSAVANIKHCVRVIGALSMPLAFEIKPIDYMLPRRQARTQSRVGMCGCFKVNRSRRDGPCRMSTSRTAQM